MSVLFGSGILLVETQEGNYERSVGEFGNLEILEKQSLNTMGKVKLMCYHKHESLEESGCTLCHVW